MRRRPGCHSRTAAIQERSRARGDPGGRGGAGEGPGAGGPPPRPRCPPRGPSSREDASQPPSE